MFKISDMYQVYTPCNLNTFIKHIKFLRPTKMYWRPIKLSAMYINIVKTVKDQPKKLLVFMDFSNIHGPKWPSICGKGH